MTIHRENASLVKRLIGAKKEKHISMSDELQFPTNPSTDEQPPANPTLDPESIARAFDALQRELDNLKAVVYGLDQPLSLGSRVRLTTIPTPVDREGARVIEGAFDGQNMTAPDGKQYSVPANYASKSKLVEGDILKLTITRDGSFIYKQIGPIDRQRLIGRLIRDDLTGEFRVESGGDSYRVLLASVTYFKGEAGDEVVILLPKEGQARWAAVENIIKKTGLETGLGEL